jgi:ribosomal protein S18 acetylase RimI-like enzyme
LTDRLTERFIDHGARILLVDTQKSNREALQFFKKQGFCNEIDHVYLSRNLSSHPGYLKKKNQVQR